MKNPFAIAILVILAIGLGVILTYQQTSSPIMRKFVAQQKEILAGQKRIEQMFNSAGVTGLGGKIDTFVRALGHAAPVPPSAPRPPSDEYTKVHQIPVGDSPVLGQKDAPVTIVEFADFQCPYCARFHPVLEKVLEEYPDQVRIVLKNFPLSFHQQARPAAKAALAAGEQGKYWDMADGLLENHRNLGGQTIDKIAQDIGLDMKKFHQDLKGNDVRYEEMINADIKLGREVGVRGTPAFYINGRQTRARDFQAYKTEIDAILNQ